MLNLYVIIGLLNKDVKFVETTLLDWIFHMWGVYKFYTYYHTLGLHMVCLLILHLMQASFQFEIVKRMKSFKS